MDSQSHQQLPMWRKAWHFVFLTIVRPMFKWVLRRVSGKCELQRIMASTQPGARRTLGIEKSLKHSKCSSLKRLLTDDEVDIDQAVAEVMKVKVINPDVHANFSAQMKGCVCQICGYRQLLQELETQRKQSYSSDNPHHENLLMELWDQLCPDVKLESRINKQWGDIGFQGDDPKTDFRGMGILGLNNLHFLVTKHTDTARNMLSRSHHPQYGYSFAITGINITALAYNLLLRGHLKTHFYNTVPQMPMMEHFHAIFCQLFCDFDTFYRDEKPKDIMQFNIVKEKYQKSVIRMLRSNKEATITGKLVSES